MKKENNLEKTIKQEISKNSVAETKVKKIEPAKIKKEKKVKPIKQKPQKALKVKKAKKKKTLKQKLYIGIAIFFIVALSIFGVGNIFTSNDFAMTLIFSQNAEKSNNIVEKLRQDIFAAPYINMFVTFETKNSETHYVTSHTTLDIKYVHYANTNTFEYVAVTKTSIAPDIKFENYYKNSVLYTKISNSTQILDKTKSNFATAQQTLTNLYPIIDQSILKFIFPTDSNEVVDNMYMLEQKSTLILPLKPIYIGQKIEISYQDNKSEIFKLNYKGEVKQRSYVLSMGLEEFITTIDYRSTNKIFNLDFPADLNTY